MRLVPQSIAAPVYLGATLQDAPAHSPGVANAVRHCLSVAKEP